MSVVLDTSLLVDHLRASAPATWRRSHPGIGVADLAIAATAEEIGTDLATRNLKHFPMFENLRAPY